MHTEEAVAAEFAFGGPAASYRNQWLCVKAAFTQKDGIVFLGTALGAKSVAANVINEWFPGRRTPKSTTLVSDDGLLVGGVLVFKARRDECYGRDAKQYLAFGKRPTRIVQTEMDERIRGTYARSGGHHRRHSLLLLLLLLLLLWWWCYYYAALPRLSRGYWAATGSR